MSTDRDCYTQDSLSKYQLYKIKHVSKFLCHANPEKVHWSVCREGETVEQAQDMVAPQSHDTILVGAKDAVEPRYTVSSVSGA